MRRATSFRFFRRPVPTLVQLCVVTFLAHNTTPVAYGQCQVKKLTASSPAAYDWFGFHIAATEGVVVVAAMGDSEREAAARNVYVFERVDGEWMESAVLSANNGDAPNRFGRSVAVSSDTILVGDPQFDLSGMGVVYVFEELVGVWQETDVFAGTQNTAFGISSAVSGDTAMIGASADPVNGSFSGVVFVYERAAGVWTSAGKLVPVDGDEFDQFGVSVGLSGDVAVVGAFRGEGNEAETGAAYVYERIAGVWTLAGKITAEDGAAGDHFGSDVAVSGEIVAVGADSYDDLGSSSGAAYVFEKVNDVWTQPKKLLADDGASGDLFGSSVGVSGETVVVGSRQDDDLGSASGAGYVFRKLDGVWTQSAKLLANDGERADFFGKSIAIGGRTIVVGGSGDDDVADQSGSASIFSFPCDDCNGNGVLDIEEKVADGDFNDDGTVDLADWRALLDCLAGPAAAPDPFVSECAFMCLDAFDADGNGMVDLKDVAAF